MGNLRSVLRACQRLGLAAEIAADAQRVAAADAVILPGVGAFGEGVANLRTAGHDAVLRRAAEEGRPLLGICLGLQLLFSWSEEHGRHEGLGILDGGVVRFPDGLTVPHMGWNQVEPTAPAVGTPAVRKHSSPGTAAAPQFAGRRPCPLFDGIPPGSHFYFAHSYHVAPADERVVAATTDYGGPFASVAARGNVFGVQFHPEKSATMGERLLTNFARLAGQV
jgi:glutamine amidotransferase